MISLHAPKFVVLTLLCVATFTIAGCGSEGGTQPISNGPAAGGDAHDDHAGHDHGETGPHDGHILETSDAHFHAEWTYTDDGKITVYILDSSAEADHPIEAESVSVETSIEGGESKTYTLAAVGEQPATAFEVSDAALLAVLKVAGHDGATATLKFSAEGKDVTADIKHADHSH